MHRGLLRAAKGAVCRCWGCRRAFPPRQMSQGKKWVVEHLCSCILDGVLSLLSLNEVI